MSDITKCTGDGCPHKTECWRYLAPSGELQNWFIETPHQIFNGVFGCKYFWKHKDSI